VKVTLIVNPTAASVTSRSRVLVRQALEADHSVDLSLTAQRGHARQLARTAADNGAEVVAVFAGDGTLNEAANGLLDHEDAIAHLGENHAANGESGPPRSQGSPALAVLPGGSTNVFARTIGVADNAVEAANQLRQALGAGSIRRVGVGTVGDRCFLFHVGMGFDAAVVQQVERRASLKRVASHALFVHCAVATWFRHYDRSRPRLALRFADDSRVDDGYFAVCLNTNPYTYLGPRPFNLAPGTSLDSGMSVVTLRTLSVIPLMAALGTALGSGKSLDRRRGVDRRAEIEAVTVTGYGPFPYQVDGDYIGEADSLTFGHRPNALALVIPPTSPGNVPNA